ncbi:MAG: phosphoglucosamine mutase [Brevinemataceae bacterium]
MSLKVSVSGIRGIWGSGLDMNAIFKYAVAFAAYVRENKGQKVLIGFDGRPTGDVLLRFTASVMNMMGLDVTDAGMVPTPTILFGVRECGFDAGIMLSASHNPLEWNAFKFVKKGGVFTDEFDLEIINKYIANPMPMPRWQEVGVYTKENTVLEKHIVAVVNAVDKELIAKSTLKVLLDPVNCSGYEASKMLFEKLGIQAYYVHNEPHGHFERPAEPTPEHLVHLPELISKYHVDVSFAQDPDADRLVVADELGNVLSEEMTPVLALYDLFQRGEKGDIVLNMSTSISGQRLNERFGGKTFRSKVGEANVVKKIAETGSFYGIEGNGGVIYPKVNTARDSLVGMALILELIARNNKPLSQIVSELDSVIMKKEKFDIKGGLEEIFIRIKEIFPEAQINEEDGLRLDLSDGAWIHLRTSNTEPVVRLIVEAGSQERINQLLALVRRVF